MPLMGLIAISGIFGSKNEDLDILPPPPPFPDIGIGKKPKDAAEEEWKIEKGERGKRLKSEKQEKYPIKKEARAKIPQVIRSAKKNGMEFPELEQKKSFFGKLFGKKDEELEMELEELGEIRPEPKKELKLIPKELPELKIPEIKVKVPKPKKEKIGPIEDISEIKLPKLEIEEGINSVDLEKAEEEIRKSIESMQGKERTSIIGGLFKRKEKSRKEPLISEVADAGKIETPEVMPRTFDKIDHVQEIEERMHKARMCLMDFKFDDAKRIYIEIMGLYSNISQKDRYKVYQDIRDLYYERKSAEKFSKI
ncbi:MAG: hypothetical protein AABX34_07150 [Nanoarchaeota archaeon]